MVKTAADDEWFWIRKIYLLLRDQSAPNFLLDWVVPVATTLLAAAAIYLAYRSYRTSKSANDQAREFRDQDRREAEVGWRRTFAVDLRDWHRTAHFEALFDVESEDSSVEFRRLIRECDKKGQDVGKRLARWLAADLRRIRSEVRVMTAKEQAKQRHPSRLFARPNEHLIDEWILDSKSVLPFLDKEESKSSAAIAAAVKEIADANARGGAKAP